MNDTIIMNYHIIFEDGSTAQIGQSIRTGFDHEFVLHQNPDIRPVDIEYWIPHLTNVKNTIINEAGQSVLPGRMLDFMLGI